MTSWSIFVAKLGITFWLCHAFCWCHKIVFSIPPLWLFSMLWCTFCDPYIKHFKNALQCGIPLYKWYVTTQLLWRHFMTTPTKRRRALYYSTFSRLSAWRSAEMFVRFFYSYLEVLSPSNWHFFLQNERYLHHQSSTHKICGPDMFFFFLSNIFCTIFCDKTPKSLKNCSVSDFSALSSAHLQIWERIFYIFQTR